MHAVYESVYVCVYSYVTKVCMLCMSLCLFVCSSYVTKVCMLCVILREVEPLMYINDYVTRVSQRMLCMITCLSLCLSVFCLSALLSVCMSVSLPFCLSVCVCTHVHVRIPVHMHAGMRTRVCFESFPAQIPGFRTPKGTYRHYTKIHTIIDPSATINHPRKRVGISCPFFFVI